MDVFHVNRNFLSEKSVWLRGEALGNLVESVRVDRVQSGWQLLIVLFVSVKVVHRVVLMTFIILLGLLGSSSHILHT